MKLIIAALKTAWKDFKSTLSQVDAYIQADAPKVQAAVQVGVGIAGALDPALAPALSVGDAIEESAMAELAAAIHSGTAVVNASDGTAAVTLSAGLYASVKALVGTLAGHPAVVAAGK